MDIFSPQKLSKSVKAKVIAPSRSLKIINEETRSIANSALKKLDIEVSFSKNSFECDEYFSSSSKSRLLDIQEAFEDKECNLILTAIGGFNSIQIIDKIDYNIIKKNPKPICGYSDITVLLNAIHSQTGMITYYGPHYSSFGMKKGNSYTINYFQKVMFSNEPIIVHSSESWSEDTWFSDQENRVFFDNPGPITIQQGYAKGVLVGGNINAFRLLNGTPYQPSLKDKILFLENDGLDAEITDREFDRRLESILLQKDGNGIQALIIGRFKSNSMMTLEKLSKIIKNKPSLEGKPVVYGYDFGHTMPLITVPIGGFCSLDANSNVPYWSLEKF